MMPLHIWCIWLSCLCMSLPTNALERTDPYESAKYYLDGLIQSLDEIETFHKPTTTEDHTRLLGSLAPICSRLARGPGKNVDDVPMTKTPGLPNPFTKHWPMPDLVPTKFSSEKVGDKMKITFDVVHSSQFYVAARLGWFDFQKKHIDAPSRGKALATSKVQIEMDTSTCNSERGSNSEVLFGLTGHDEHSVLVVIDICKGQRKRKRKGLPQEIPLPMFRILSDPGDEIFIEAEVDPTFEIDVHLYEHSLFQIEFESWNWNLNKFEKDYVTIEYDSGDEPSALRIDVRPGHSGLAGASLLKVDVLSEVEVNSTIGKSSGYYDEDDADEKEINARIRITTQFATRRLGGKLALYYNYGRLNWEPRQAVEAEDVVWKRVISIVFPDQMSAFPANAVDVKGEDVMCDDEGDRNRGRRRRNCRVQCSAHGTDLQYIFILKTDQYRPPVKSINYVIENSMGFAKLDVGPASDDNAGTYRCVVVTKDLTIRSTDVQVYTSGFTKVDSLVVEDLQNGTSKVTCSAVGLQPMNMSLVVHNYYEDYERVDNKTGSIAVLERSDVEGIEMTYYLSTSELTYPVTHLDCIAVGELGEDEKNLHLWQIIRNDDQLQSDNKQF